MSCTEIWALDGKGQGKLLGDVRNAFRAAMYVWNDVAKRYCGMETFPFFGGEGQNRVWNADKDIRMPDDEKIVLRSTMTGATCAIKDRDALVSAFRSYGKRHPDSSLSDQAEVIASAEIPEGWFVGINQTSVVDFWGIAGRDDEDEEYVFVNFDDYKEKFDILTNQD